MKKLISMLIVLALLLTLLPPVAYAATKVDSGTCGENVTWTLDDAGTLTISGTGIMMNYGLLPRSPFWDLADKIRTIVIEEGVQSVGNTAFPYCTNVTSVSIPKSVTAVGRDAFFDCGDIGSITFAGDAPSFDEYSFYGATATVYYPANNATWTQDVMQNYGGTITWEPVGEADALSGTCGANVTWTLDDAGTLTISGTGAMANYGYESPYPDYAQYSNRIQKLVIEEGVTEVGAYAFLRFSVLTEVTFPQSLKSIGTGAFCACFALEEIQLPSGITAIEASTFATCPALKSITIHKNISEIGNVAFYNCTGLKEIHFLGNAPEMYSRTFDNVTATAYYPAGDSTWTEDVKQNYDGNITWKAVGEADAFSGTCGDNVTWTLDNSGTLTISGTGAMDDYGEYENIAPYLTYKDDIQKVVIENGVTAVGSNAFCGCEMLTDVSISESVTSLGNSSFWECSALEEIPLPSGLTTLGGMVFGRCTALKRIRIPEGITRLPVGAFMGCTSLTSITIPAGVTLIQSSFSQCTGLKEIHFLGNAPTIWQTDSFYSTNSFYNVTATAYYPAGNPTWTKDVMQNYGGTITWVPYGGCEHTETKIQNAKNATCTETGYTGDTVCTLCGETLTPGEEIPIQNHTFESGKCTVCGQAAYGSSGTCGENLTWKLDSSGTLTISGTGTMTEYWTEDSPFMGLADLITAVVIEKGVRSIGGGAFTYCENIASVTIPDSVICISPLAFFNCTKLRELTIPYSVSSIGVMAFSGCTALNNICFQGEAPEIQIYAFMDVEATVKYPEGCKTWNKETMQNYGGTLKWVMESSGCTHGYTVTQNARAATQTQRGYSGDTVCEICGAYLKAGRLLPSTQESSGACGENVTWKLDNAGTLTISGTGDMDEESYFWDKAEMIEKVIIQEGVTSVGDGKFLYCWKLQSVTIPDSVTRIGHFAFTGCFALEDVALPQALSTIGMGAFGVCMGLTDVTIPAGVAEIDSSAFASCFLLDSITFTGNAPAIGDNCFENVTATVYYPANDPTWTAAVKQSYGGTLAWKAGNAADNTPGTGSCGENVTWTLDSAGTLTISGTGAMYNYAYEEWAPYYESRNKIRKVVIENGVTSIGDWAFANCPQIREVKIPGSVTGIGESAFMRCTSLQSVTIPDSVLRIGGYAFQFCESMTKAVVSSRLTVFSEYVFSHCYSLTDISIPQGVTSLEEGAFWTSTALTTISLPDTVTSIGDLAFEDCTNLSSIIFAGSAPSIHQEAFTGVTANAYYPAGNATWTAAVKQNYGGTLTWQQGNSRLAGDHRYETAMLAADQMLENLGMMKFDAVVVASGQEFPDALSGSYLAAAKNAPILLASNIEKANKLVQDYINKNLKQGGIVYILGGENAIPSSFEEGLGGFITQRLAGNHRFQTNLKVLNTARVDDQPILVCTGGDFADSLSASATKLPILLVHGDTLFPEQKEFLETHRGNPLYIIGGPGAVSESLEAELRGYGTVKRLAGRDRFETSVLIAREFFDHPQSAVLAYAADFPDGLCGGSLATTMNAPLILTMKKYEAPAQAYIQEQQISRGVILGGEKLIPEASVQIIFGTK